MNLLEQLKSVLCDPAGKCCITGSDEDRAIVDRALQALAEQPARQVVDSEEKAGAYMEARLWEFIDMAAAWPKARPDPRTWDHVMVYAPKPAQQESVEVDQATMKVASK